MFAFTVLNTNSLVTLFTILGTVGASGDLAPLAHLALVCGFLLCFNNNVFCVAFPPILLFASNRVIRGFFSGFNVSCSCLSILLLLTPQGLLGEGEMWDVTTGKLGQAADIIKRAGLPILDVEGGLYYTYHMYRRS